MAGGTGSPRSFKLRYQAALPLHGGAVWGRRAVLGAIRCRCLHPLSAHETQPRATPPPPLLSSGSGVLAGLRPACIARRAEGAPCSRVLPGAPGNLFFRHGFFDRRGAALARASGQRRWHSPRASSLHRRPSCPADSARFPLQRRDREPRKEQCLQGSRLPSLRSLPMSR